MISIKLKLAQCSNNNCGNPDYDSLFNKINKRIYKYSKLEYNNLRFFLNKKLNCDDEDAYDKLLYYRELLTRKLAGDECLCDFSTQEIISRIKKLLR